MKIAVGADHAGYDLKQKVVMFLDELGVEVIDVGAHELDDSDDYPDFALLLGRAVVSAEAERGIMLCGSGVGANIALNKIDGIRASVCHDIYSAHQGVEHDDMNVLCIGGRIIDEELAIDLVKSFVEAKFTSEDRHMRRLKKALNIEKNHNLINCILIPSSMLLAFGKIRLQ